MSLVLNFDDPFLVSSLSWAGLFPIGGLFASARRCEERFVGASPRFRRPPPLLGQFDTLPFRRVSCFAFASQGFHSDSFYNLSTFVSRTSTMRRQIHIAHPHSGSHSKYSFYLL